MLPLLPPRTTVDEIFKDYLSYIKTQLQKYVTDQYGDGAVIWDALYPTMEVVLTAPNGWEITQQQRMRTAGIKSGLVSGWEAGKRIHFVSEAEVSNNIQFQMPKLTRFQSGGSSFRSRQWMHGRMG